MLQPQARIAMPIYTLSTLGGVGPQLRLACDGPDCQSGFMMTRGKTRDQLIERAQECGFTVTGPAGSEKIFCPECSKQTVPSS